MTTEVLKVLIPIVTFVFGCTFTFLIKRIHDRKQLRQSSIREVCRLTTEWYNQIHGFPKGFKGESIERDFNYKTDSSMYEYVYNRLILPDLVMHLAVIERYPQCSKLAKKVKQFLNTVTKCSTVDANTERLQQSQPLLGESRALLVRTCNPISRNYQVRVTMLQRLDQIVQGVANEAGRLIK